MFNERIQRITICAVIILSQALGYAGLSQDQTSARANTLFDDVDDTQKQLDNEAKDRYKYGRPKSFWVFHFPTHIVGSNVIDVGTKAPYDYILRKMRHKNKQTTTELRKRMDWTYDNQDCWSKYYPRCGGKYQSPVDVSIGGLVKTRGHRPLTFLNHGVKPNKMDLIKDGKRVMITGKWPVNRRPMIYGGAAHSRRYLFDSMIMHWPSEHTIEGRMSVIESQLLFVSAEYDSVKTAINASTADPLAFLAIANLYKSSNHSHIGLLKILSAMKQLGFCHTSFPPTPLSYFNPPFKKYVAYQGSLTVPPCTESVLWIIRGEVLPVTKAAVNMVNSLTTYLYNEPRTNHFQLRLPQPINDRKFYLFK